MSEYISKKEAIEAFSDMSDGVPITHGDMISDTTAVNVIKSISPADVRENIHASWIELPKAFNSNELPCKCSNPKCGEILSFMNGYPKSKFCPSCGAIMDGEPKGEKGTE